MYNREWDWAASRGGGVTIFIFSVTHFLNVPLGVEKWIRLDSE